MSTEWSLEQLFWNSFSSSCFRFQCANLLMVTVCTSWKPAKDYYIYSGITKMLIVCFSPLLKLTQHMTAMQVARGLLWHCPHALCVWWGEHTLLLHSCLGVQGSKIPAGPIHPRDCVSMLKGSPHVPQHGEAPRHAPGCSLKGAIPQSHVYGFLQGEG